MPFESGGTVPCKKLSFAKDVCIGDTTIELSDGIDRILYAGTRISFGTEESPKIVYISNEHLANTTSILIKKATVSIDNAETANLEAYIPISSAKEINKGTPIVQEFKDQNFSSSIATGISNSSSTRSIMIIDTNNIRDYGFDIIRNERNTGRLVRLSVIEANGSGQYANVFIEDFEDCNNRIVIPLIVQSSRWIDWSINP